MNKNIISYKGYIAELALDLEENIIIGRVTNTADIISFHGNTLNEVKKAFHDVLDSYLEVAKQAGIDPSKPYSGKFNLRISPYLHRQLTMIAKLQKKSLNEYTETIINNALQKYEHKSIKRSGAGQ